MGKARWQGSLEAMHNVARKARNGKREDLLVTELTAENLSLKKGVLV